MSYRTGVQIESGRWDFSCGEERIAPIRSEMAFHAWEVRWFEG